ncbi:MAG: pantoate--beta-alanine ligase [Bacteroidales bacterium]|nr:pantoate--beta-alanine ligase [Bacteroidales bacterium]
MLLIETISDLQNKLEQAHRANQTIGLVPTMGALHEGHLSLIKRARKENDLCVVSVFVNPTQFNNAEDLEKYPRTLEQDLQLVSDYADIVFAPSVEEVYRVPATEQYDFGPVAEVMEGPARPGHFNGVGIIVKRLFDWVQPTRAYFGEKDFQQIAVIKTLVRQCGLNLQIVPCPIVRETSGLALSSRNRRLTEEERTTAANIYRILKASTQLKTTNTQEIRKFVEEEINKYDLFRLEYYEIVDDETLQPIADLNDSHGVVGCITVWANQVRLIDNIRYK